jgi:hypothetical protein
LGQGINFGEKKFLASGGVEIIARSGEGGKNL